MFTNVFVLTVADSGTGKSTATDIVERIMKEPLDVHTLPGEGSPQGYVRSLQERCEYRKEQGLHPFVSDGLLIADEYRVVIGSDSYKQQTPVWFTDWFTKTIGPWRRTLAGSSKLQKPEQQPQVQTYPAIPGLLAAHPSAPPQPQQQPTQPDIREYIIESPRLSISAGSNMTWLLESNRAILGGGYIPRHFLYDCPGARWPNAANPKGLQRRVFDQLQNDLQYIVPYLPDRIELTDEAWAYLEVWYATKGLEWEREYSEDQKTWIQRKLEGTIKKAAMGYLINGCHLTALRKGEVPKITAYWAAWGARYADWYDSSTRRIQASLGMTREGQLAAGVLGLMANILQTVPEARVKGIPERWIAQQLKHLGPGKVRKVLSELEGDGLIYKNAQLMGEGKRWLMR
jgi:hypothetical protein